MVFQVIDGRRLSLPLLGLQEEGATRQRTREPPETAKGKTIAPHQSLKKGIQSYWHFNGSPVGSILNV